jgi:serine/threonine protein kinase/Tfp pilus assembly protein PilF
MSSSSTDSKTTSPLPAHSDTGLPPPSPTTGKTQPHERQIGDYHLLEPIGEGGMGVVYRAEQRHPIKRVVALKLIRLGMASDQVIARFESERQALALMNHPNIAKVLDAGTSDSGQPYFVMEYVPGEPITRFCDNHHFTIKQRLGLFAQACDAVQHAHQKAIIHRDLKPGNILVTLQDVKPVVKVIDFGLAKATATAQQKLTDRTLYTEAGQLVGTREYMSPEQADLNADAADVDTRTDIYSLGVVLYELLIGALPFNDLRTANHAEVQRIIREVDPPRPSTRLSGLGAGAEEIAKKRRTELPQLDKQLKSELEWIPLKAMRKDRARRYSTVAELAQDVENYLHQRPLTAAPESTAYLLRKLIRRNKGPVIAAASVLLVLVAGIVGTTIGLVGQARQRAIADREARNAKDEAAKQQAVSNFLAEMLAAADPQRLLGDKVTVLQATREALKRLDDGALKDQPQIEAAVRTTIGTTLAGLSRYADAEVVLQKALDLRRKTLAANDPEIGKTLIELAGARQMQGKLAEAEALVREAMKIFQTSLGPRSAEVGTALDNLASNLNDQGKLVESEKLYRDALSIAREKFPAGTLQVAIALNNLGWSLKDQGKFPEAEQLFREAVDIFRARLPDGHPDLAAALNNVAVTLDDQGRFAQAEPLFREALAIRRRSLPPGHVDIARSLNDLGEVLQAQNKLAEAEPLLREALEIRRKGLPPTHADIGASMNNLASLLQTEEKLDEAETLYRDALAIYRAAMPPGHRHIATMLNNLSRLLIAKGSFSQAEPLLLEALEIYRRALPAGHPLIATTLTNLGVVQQNQGKLQEAEALHREALEIRRKFLSPAHPDIAQSLSNLASVLRAQGRSSEVEPLARGALEIWRNALPNDHPMLAQGLHNLATFYDEQGKSAEAEPLYREALEIRRKAVGPRARPTTQTAAALAGVLDSMNRGEEAAALRREFQEERPTIAP